MGEVDFDDKNHDSKTKKMQRDLSVIMKLHLSDDDKEKMKELIISKYKTESEHETEEKKIQLNKIKHSNSVLEDITILQSVTQIHFDKVTSLELHQKSLKIVNYLKTKSKYINKYMDFDFEKRINVLLSTIKQSEEGFINLFSIKNYSLNLSNIQELSYIISETLFLYYCSISDKEISKIVWSHECFEEKYSYGGLTEEEIWNNKRNVQEYIYNQDIDYD